MMSKRIAFIYFSFSSFIRQDYEILSNHYNVIPVKFSGAKDIVRVINAVRTSDVSYSWFADVWAFFAVVASKAFRKKSIVVVGGYDVANEPEIAYGMGTQNIIRRLMTKLSLKYADVVLPVSKFTQRETERSTKNNIRTVYNCVDSDKFTPSDAKKEMVLTVGNKIKLKGIDTFIEAAWHLPRIQFMIIGTTDDSLRELKQYCNIPTNVQIMGDIANDEIARYYQQSKVYCQLSYRESFSVSLAEAMACGCTPVVTSRGALPEVVGDEGYYVEYGNTDATVVAIEKAFSDTCLCPRKQITANFLLSRREATLKTIVDFNLKDMGTRNRMQKSIKMANVQSGERVLDLGCSDSSIKAILPNGTAYIGIDIESGDMNYDLEHGIPSELKDSKFDVVFMNEFIEHIENFRSLLIQCRNLLSDNGRIIISTPSPNRVIFSEDPTHIHCFRKLNMYNLASICGLQIDKITGTYLGIPRAPMISSSQTLLTGVMIYKLTVAEQS